MHTLFPCLTFEFVRRLETACLNENACLNLSVVHMQEMCFCFAALHCSCSFLGALGCSCRQLLLSVAGCTVHGPGAHWPNMSGWPSGPATHTHSHCVRLVSFGLVPAGGCSRGAGSSSRAGGCSRRAGSSSRAERSAIFNSNFGAK